MEKSRWIASSGVGVTVCWTVGNVLDMELVHDHEHNLLHGGRMLQEKLEWKERDDSLAHHLAFLPTHHRLKRWILYDCEAESGFEVRQSKHCKSPLFFFRSFGCCGGSYAPSNKSEIDLLLERKH